MVTKKSDAYTFVKSEKITEEKLSNTLAKVSVCK